MWVNLNELKFVGSNSNRTKSNQSELLIKFFVCNLIRLCRFQKGVHVHSLSSNPIESVRVSCSIFILNGSYFCLIQFIWVQSIESTFIRPHSSKVMSIRENGCWFELIKVASAESNSFDSFTKTSSWFVLFQIKSSRLVRISVSSHYPKFLPSDWVRLSGIEWVRLHSFSLKPNEVN